MIEPVVSYILGIVSACLALSVVATLLRRGRLRERHAIWWLVGSVLALIAAVFPQLLVLGAHVLGVQVPSNLAFFLSIALLFFVCIQHSSELTTLEERTRTLAERVALQELELERLRSASRPETASTGHDHPGA